MQLNDIIANMRNYADRLEASGGYPSPEDLRTFAGGIEQAVEELKRSRGNVEAMRKALKRVESELSTMNPRGWSDTLAYVRAALAAPPRNCDVKYADEVEMYGAFKDWCKAKGHTMEPMLAYDAFEWLLDTAKGEVNDKGEPK